MRLREVINLHRVIPDRVNTALAITKGHMGRLSNRRTSNRVTRISRNISSRVTQINRHLMGNRQVSLPILNSLLVREVPISLMYKGSSISRRPVTKCPHSTTRHITILVQTKSPENSICRLQGCDGEQGSLLKYEKDRDELIRSYCLEDDLMWIRRRLWQINSLSTESFLC